MNDFLLHIAWLTISMSAVVVLVLLWNKVFGRFFSAKSRYAVWKVVMLTFCIGVCLFKLPSPVILDVSIPSFAESTVSDVESAPQTPETPTSTPAKPAPAVPNAPLPYKPPAEPVSGGTVLSDSESSSFESREEYEHEAEGLNASKVILCIWAVGAVSVLTVSLAAHIRITRKYSRSKSLCDRETEEIFQTICKEYGLRRLPRIYMCEYVGSPVLYGYLHPTVLLPNLQLPKDSLRGILSHELTHYRRGDLFVKLACLLTQSLYWFNPMAYVASARCNAEMELSCDEAVLSGMDEDRRRAYGSVMLKIVRNCCHEKILTTGFNPQKSAVKERIMNILDMRKKKHGKAIVAIFLLLCTVACTAIGCAVKDAESGETQISFEEGIDTEYEALDSYMRYLVGYFHEPFEKGEVTYSDTVIGLVYEYCFYNREEINGIEFEEDSSMLYIDGEVFRQLSKILSGDTFEITEDVDLSLVGGSYSERSDTYTTCSAKDYWGEDRYYIKPKSGISYTEENGKVCATALVGKRDEVYGGYVPYRALKYIFDEVTVDGITHYSLEEVTYIEDAYNELNSIMDDTVTYEGERLTAENWLVKYGYSVERYTQADLSRDGYFETVLWLLDGDGKDYGFLILHEEEDEMYAYLLDFDKVSDLCQSGFFRYTDSGEVNQICSLSFESGACSVDKVTYSETTPDGEIAYYIFGSPATKEEYELSMQTWNDYGEAEWYDRDGRRVRVSSEEIPALSDDELLEKFNEVFPEAEKTFAIFCGFCPPTFTG